MRGPRREDLTGLRFNNLTAVAFSHRNKDRAAIWQCRCVCGNITYVRSVDLRSLRLIGCGCVQRRPRTHGHCLNRKQTTLYRAWRDIHTRCYKPHYPGYKWYGGRGIQVCVRWHKSNPNGFQNFASDMGDRPSEKHCIDRINNSLSYMPVNCHWATWKEAAKNQRHRNQFLKEKETMHQLTE